MSATRSKESTLGTLRAHACTVAAQALTDDSDITAVISLTPPLVKALQHWQQIAQLHSTRFDARATLSVSTSTDAAGVLLLDSIEVQSTDNANVSLMRSFLPAHSLATANRHAVGVAAAARASRSQHHGLIDTTRLQRVARKTEAPTLPGRSCLHDAFRVLVLRGETHDDDDELACAGAVGGHDAAPTAAPTTAPTAARNAAAAAAKRVWVERELLFLTGSQLSMLLLCAAKKLGGGRQLPTDVMQYLATTAFLGERAIGDPVGSRLETPAACSPPSRAGADATSVPPPTPQRARPAAAAAPPFSPRRGASVPATSAFPPPSPRAARASTGTPAPLAASEARDSAEADDDEREEGAAAVAASEAISEAAGDDDAAVEATDDAAAHAGDGNDDDSDDASGLLTVVAPPADRRRRDLTLRLSALRSALEELDARGGCDVVELRSTTSRADESRRRRAAACLHIFGAPTPSELDDAHAREQQWRRERLRARARRLIARDVAGGGASSRDEPPSPRRASRAGLRLFSIAPPAVPSRDGTAAEATATATGLPQRRGGAADADNGDDEASDARCCPAVGDAPDSELCGVRSSAPTSATAAADDEEEDDDLASEEAMIRLKVSLVHLVQFAQAASAVAAGDGADDGEDGAVGRSRKSGGDGAGGASVRIEFVEDWPLLLTLSLAAADGDGSAAAAAPATTQSQADRARLDFYVAPIVMD